MRTATGARLAAAAGVSALAALAAAPGFARQPPLTTAGTLTGDAAASYSPLRPAPGWDPVVRTDLGSALPGRSSRRRSLIYFTALDEIHYTDEESPGRVEFLDAANTPLTAAFNPSEGLRPFSTDQVFRAVNAWGASPIPQGDGSRARMALAVTTGDNIDNQQANESAAFLRLLEGGTLDPNSGVDTPLCAFGSVPAGEARRYTGVQDYNDYLETGSFYDPNRPLGSWAAWPRYPGLMDRAQQPFAVAGLSVPSYVSLGNHDRLQQGNQFSNAGFEAVAKGCAKIFAPVPLTALNPSFLTSNPAAVVAVPRDPGRRSLSYPQLHGLYASGRQRDAHGFGYVDPAELRASRGAASYYSWSPRPGIRMVALNTVSEGGVTGPSSNGNLDDPQFRWLARTLAAARRANELVIVYGHHPIASMDSRVPDEAAPPCLASAPRDPNAGCDLDPRSSQPIRTGSDLAALLEASPNVVAYVAGHTGAIRNTPFARPGGGGFWQIESGSVSDWPNNARLIDVMDNGDGTLSLIERIVTQDVASNGPASGTAASAFSPATMASVDRALSFNDPQSNPLGGLGRPGDRNAELLLRDPRTGVRRCATAPRRLTRRGIGRARLGARRAAVRRGFARSSASTPRRSIDRFCLAGGGALRVGYPSGRLNRRLSARTRRRVRGRAVLVLSSRLRYRAARVGPGMRTATLRRRVRRRVRIRIGANTWYVSRTRRAALVFKVRRGRVREVGVADRRIARTDRGARRLLASFR